MRYSTASAFRTALEHRITSRSRADGVSVMRLRKLVVFDRLLARLQVVGENQWVLKGALALQLRFDARSRTTKDMDLATVSDPCTVAEELLAASVLDAGDWFVFSLERVSRLDDLIEGAGERYRASAELAGRRFDEAIVDVALGDVPQDLEIITCTDLLQFAGIQPIQVAAIPVEYHVAEKLHAYSRQYAAGRCSTRTKDLVDLVIIASCQALSAQRLRTALEQTFRDRRMHGLPPAVPLPSKDWTVPYRAMAREVGRDPEVAAGHNLVSRLLNPILGLSVAPEALWNPQEQSWTP